MSPDNWKDLKICSPYPLDELIHFVNEGGWNYKRIAEGTTEAEISKAIKILNELLKQYPQGEHTQETHDQPESSFDCPDMIVKATASFCHGSHCPLYQDGKCTHPDLQIG